MSGRASSPKASPGGKPKGKKDSSGRSSPSPSGRSSPTNASAGKDCGKSPPAKSGLAAAKGSMGKNAKMRKPKKIEEVELTEEEKAVKKAADRKKFVENYCTRMDFIMKDGKTYSKLLEGERFETYVEMQRALARITPRSLQIFMCLSLDGIVMTKQSFQNNNAYKIKEMPNAKLEATAKSKFKPQVDPRWEFYDYHGGAPEGWVDKIEVAAEKKRLALKAAKERERQDAIAAKMMARLTAGEADSDESDDGAFDDL